jgi:hypothetical protein
MGKPISSHFDRIRTNCVGRKDLDEAQRQNLAADSEGRRS